MLDDETFARAWVESRDRARPRGERAIRDELRLKGIDRATSTSSWRSTGAPRTPIDEDGETVGLARTGWPRNG